MSSKYLAKSRSFVYASRLSRLSPLHHEPVSLITPEKLPEHHSFTPTKSKSHLHDKVDSILKHNNYLLNQNNKFVSLIRDKDNQLILLQNRIDQLEGQLSVSITGLKTMEHERNHFIVSCKEEITTKEYEISQLLTHTDMLKSKLSSLESQHKIQILNLKQGLIIQSELKYENSKKSQMYSTEMYQLQILKLKELIDTNTREYQSKSHQHNITIKQQDEEIRKLTSEIKHIQSVNILTLEEERMNFENKLSQIKRELINRHQTEKGEYQIMVKRLKKDISEKEFENNRLNQKMEHMQENNQAEYDLVNQERTKANIEIEQMEIRNKELLNAQRTLLQELAQSEAENVKVCTDNFIKTLESESKKLFQINSLKTQEIVKLQTEIIQLKQTHAAQLQQSENYEQTLQSKLHTQQTHNQQEAQFLKVKMAQLHQCDITSLLSSYEKQIIALCEKIKKLEESYKDCRGKLHKQLQQKTELRKHYQVEISKLYNKNLELKVMIQTKNIEMKQNSQSMNLKHSAVSLGLIKNSENQQKQKDKREEDNKKLQQLIVCKDLQIAVLNQKLSNAKKSLEDEKKEHTLVLDTLKATNESLINSQRKEKEFYQKELKKKSDEFKQQKSRLEEELENAKGKTYQDLLKQLQRLQKQKSVLEMRVQKQMAQKQYHIKASNTNQQIAEVLRLESSVAIEQQKSNSKAQQEMEGEKWKKTYKEQMESKSREIEQLKRRLLMKEQDLREGENREKDLEMRLEGFVQLLKTKSDLEKKVMSLGMDNNLIKNQAELFKE